MPCRNHISLFPLPNDQQVLKNNNLKIIRKEKSMQVPRMQVSQASLLRVNGKP